MAKRNGYLYLVKLFNQHESFFKIGATVHKFGRYYQLMKAGYQCELVYALNIGYDSELYQLEHELHYIYRHVSYTPLVKFPGYRECYKFIDVNNHIELLRQLFPFNVEVIKNIPITWR